MTCRFGGTGRWLNVSSYMAIRRKRGRKTDSARTDAPFEVAEAS